MPFSFGRVFGILFVDIGYSTICMGIILAQFFCSCNWDCQLQFRFWRRLNPAARLRVFDSRPGSGGLVFGYEEKNRVPSDRYYTLHGPAHSGVRFFRSGQLPAAFRR